MQQIQGVFPVVSTPFDQDGALSIEELDTLIAYCARAGAHGVVYPAIASEFATLDAGERRTASQAALSAAHRENLPAVIGVSSNTPEESRELSQIARDSGAAAVMLMVPRSAGQQPHEVARFITEATGGLGDLDIVLQNAPPPLGSCLSTDSLAETLHRTPWVRYIKEENVPCGQRMTRLMSALGDKLGGVFGGAGGRFVLDEYARGACGTMPSCEMVEVHRTLWDLAQEDHRAEARDVFRVMLPLLDMAAVFRQSVVIEVLLQRGLLASARIRDENPVLDQADRREIKINLEKILPLIEDFYARREIEA